MLKKHDAQKGCEICQNHHRFRPHLGKLQIKNHPAPEGGRLAAAELEVSWDGKVNGVQVAARRRELGPASKKAAEKWGGKKGHDGYGPYGFELCMAPASGSKFSAEADQFVEAFKEDEVYVDEECGGH